MSLTKPIRLAAFGQHVLMQRQIIAARRFIVSSWDVASSSSLAPSFLSSLPRSPIPACIGSFQTRQFSRTSGLSVFGWMRDKWEQNEKTKQAAKLVDQIALMANTPVWTVKMFKDEVDETLSSWRTKIPGMGGTAQVQAAKDTQKVVNAMVNQLGGGATAQDVANMDRKQKLKLAIECELSMNEVNVILKQFRQMELMHRILRYRKEKGLALPSDAEGLKMAMQQDGVKILTNAEKREMRETMAKSQQQN
ncbi:hypothetical protein HJC23_005050 [Cyclotella cryptica]|uniref:Signal recognition particle SRP54 subunit M-domain domain-containing protein n=1 Tax=Cyclotella cryptica TaxID=29204 RepID=A0ABD3QE76_9STRA|eukprot:CCRYP_006282-RA/>CCRYP_006282-RA protein AED:0.05 eAED:0.04 QI:0/-1/0/1/-1/1/1/0/249